MEGVININGVIGEDVVLVDVISQVRKQKEATSFIVYIDSAGGQVDVGFDIFNYLKSLGLPIKTVGRGVVASIATVIFLAGGRREVLQGTTFMIHYPMVMQLEYATSEMLDSTSKELKKIEQQVKTFYSKNTGLDEETISVMLKNETYMSEEQLFDLGFTTQKEPAKIAAVLKLNNEKMAEKNEKEVGNKILNLISNFLKGNVVAEKILYGAEQDEIVFPDLAEDDEVTVGARATINNEPATGKVVMADGRTFVFENGELVEIQEEVVEEEPTDEVAELKERIQTLESEKEQAMTVINRIKGIQSQMVTEDKKEKTETRTKKKADRPLSGAIAKLKKA